MTCSIQGPRGDWPLPVLGIDFRDGEKRALIVPGVSPGEFALHTEMT